MKSSVSQSRRHPRAWFQGQTHFAHLEHHLLQDVYNKRFPECRRHAIAADLVEAKHALKALAPRLPPVAAAVDRNMRIADAYIKVCGRA